MEDHVKRLTFVSLLSVVCTLGQAQTAVFSMANATAKADADIYDGQYDEVQAVDSQSWSLNPLSAHANAYNGTSDGSMAYTVAVSSSFVSAAQGRVDTYQAFEVFAVTTMTRAFSTPQANLWEYTFDLTQSSEFRLNHNVTGTGFTFGLQAFVFVVNGVPYQLSPNWWEPYSNGTVALTLAPGQHSVSLINGSNLETTGNSARAGSSTGGFDWQITPVPEPGTMAALGLGVLAFLRRRR